VLFVRFFRAHFSSSFLFAYFCRLEEVCFFVDENIENDQPRDRFSSPKTGETSEEMHSPSDSSICSARVFRDAVSRAVFSSRREKAPFRKQQHVSFLD
jgi:hypothetical protein